MSSVIVSSSSVSNADYAQVPLFKIAHDDAKTLAKKVHESEPCDTIVLRNVYGDIDVFLECVEILLTPCVDYDLSKRNVMIIAPYRDTVLFGIYAGHKISQYTLRSWVRKLMDSIGYTQDKDVQLRTYVKFGFCYVMLKMEPDMIEMAERILSSSCATIIPKRQI